jgi:predicted CXXCH cytochrome family protein
MYSGEYWMRRTNSFMKREAKELSSNGQPYLDNCLSCKKKKRRTVMKKSILACVAAGLLLICGSVAMAGVNPGTGIKQTSHDLSSGGVGAAYVGAGTADNLDRICIYCHAPHHAIPAADATTLGLTYYPLWNHKVTTETYDMYSNGTDVPNDIASQLNADVSGQPGGVSRLCLSCHDGSLAISEYGYDPSSTKGMTKAAGGDAVSGRFLIGSASMSSLKNHHPIGFDYEAVAAVDDEINPTDSSLLGANVYGLTINDLLWGGKMECSSCHDVHNTKNEGSKFTWVQDTRSNLCLTCHNK